MVMQRFSQWYFSENTTEENRSRYAIFMLIAFCACVASFSPLFVGYRIGAALYVSTFLLDLYLQLTLPIKCKFPLSFLVGTVVVAGVFAALKWL